MGGWRLAAGPGFEFRRDRPSTVSLRLAPSQQQSSVIGGPEPLCSVLWLLVLASVANNERCPVVRCPADPDAALHSAGLSLVTVDSNRG